MKILCIAASLLGRPFMLEAKRLGHDVYLLTKEKLLKCCIGFNQVKKSFKCSIDSLTLQLRVMLGTHGFNTLYSTKSRLKVKDKAFRQYKH